MQVKELATNSPVIYVIDIKTGKRVGVYQGVRHASRELGLDKSGSGISKVLKGQRKSHGGYRFEYAKPEDVVYASTVKMSDWQFRKNLRQMKVDSIDQYKAIATQDKTKQKDLLAELQNRANKRIKAIQESGYDSPAVYKRDGKLFNFEYDNGNKYYSKIYDLEDFLEAHSSTVEGAREYTKNLLERLGIETDENFEMTDELRDEIKEFWKIYHRLRDNGKLSKILGKKDEKYKEGDKEYVELFQRGIQGMRKKKRIQDMTETDIEGLIKELENIQIGTPIYVEGW